MYPFYLFDLPLSTTDEDVSKRYHQLLKMYPPDLDPEKFALVRKCYEMIKDHKGRLKTFLFYFDPTGRALMDEPLFKAPKAEKRSRLSPTRLAALLNDRDLSRSKKQSRL